MFRTMMALCGATILMATPASAARFLYSYVDTSGLAALAVTAGPLSGVGSVAAQTCLTDGALCASAGYQVFDVPGIFTFAPDGTTSVPSYFSRAAADTPGVYADGNTARLAVVALADSDWVYSYVDTFGLAAFAVVSGPLSGDGSLQAMTCLAGGVLCASVSYQVFDLAGIFTFAPDAATSVPSYFSREAARTPGIYDDGNIARLAVIGAAVPEPATWAMMIGGFGLVGSAMRRRRTTRAGCRLPV